MGKVKGDSLGVGESREGLGLDDGQDKLGVLVLVELGGREDGCEKG